MLVSWLQIFIEINRDPTQLPLNVLDTLLLLVGCRVSKDEVHIFKSLVKYLSDCSIQWYRIHTLPRVSGIQKNVNARARRQKAAKKM